MKRYLIISTVLPIPLLAACEGGELAQEEGLPLETVGKALAALAARVNPAGQD